MRRIREKSKTNISIFLICSVMCIYVFIYYFFLIKSFLPFCKFINASFILFLSFFCYLLFGFKKDKITNLKKSIIEMIIIYVICYYLILFLIGIFSGFSKNIFSLEVFSVFNNLFVPIIVILFGEIIRYILINKTDNIFVKVMITISMIFLDCVGVVNLTSFSSFLNTFKVISATIIPIIFKNFMLSYLTDKVGYKPCIIYKIVIDLLIIVIPFYPNIGDYVSIVLGICLPYLLFVRCSRLIDEYENGKKRIFKKDAYSLSDLPYIFVVFIMFFLISGVFPIFMIGVSTGSMEPAIKSGDAVVVYRVKSVDELQKNDIIVYEYDGKMIVHRIVSIKNGIIVAKGDANILDDEIEIKIGMIKGKVLFKVPYIAKPSIYINELFN